MAIGEQSWIMQIGIYWRRKKQSGSKDKVKTKSWIALNQNLLLQLNSGVVLCKRKMMAINEVFTTQHLILRCLI